MNIRSVALIVAVVLFLWSAGASTAPGSDFHINYGTPGVLTNLGLVAVAVYWFLTDHPPIRR